MNRDSDYDIDIAKMYGSASPSLLFTRSEDLKSVKSDTYGVAYYPTDSSGTVSEGELLTNSSFDAGYVGWSRIGDGDFDIVDGVALLYQEGELLTSLYQAFTTEEGIYYELEVEYSFESGTGVVRVGDMETLYQTSTVSGTDTTSIRFQALSEDVFIQFLLAEAETTVEIYKISVKRSQDQSS